MCSAYSIEDWLKGMVDYEVPDTALKSIMYNNAVAFGTPVSEIPEKDRELCLADLYVWLSMSSTTNSGELVADGGWQHQKASRNISDRAGLRSMARRIYEKWCPDKAVAVVGGNITMKPIY